MVEELKTQAIGGMAWVKWTLGDPWKQACWGDQRSKHMKFGPRIPSFKKRISARTSPARFVRNSLGLKAPRGWGWLSNPRKAAYKRVYNRTSFGLRGCALIFLIPGGVLACRWMMN
ncbi:MAG: hypothetical protein Q8O19_03045 [Rectinemataceae bacterium]|nr:hypothetical protein [Rectinemataceae bacterium]